MNPGTHDRPTSGSTDPFPGLLWCLRHGSGGPLGRLRSRIEGLPEGHADRVAVEGGIGAIETAIRRLERLISKNGRNG